MIGSCLIAGLGYGMAIMCAICAVGSMKEREVKTAWANMALSLVFAGITFSLVN